MILTIPAAIAADAAGNSAAGHWEGAIQTPGSDLAFVVDIAKSGDGKLGGAIAMPSEKVHGLPLKGVTVDGTSVRFHARLDQEVNGYFAGDGDEIKGDITVEGHQLPIYLKRTGDAKIEPRTMNTTIAKPFEGSWTATLGSEKLRLKVLTNLPRRHIDRQRSESGRRRIGDSRECDRGERRGCETGTEGSRRILFW